MVSVAVQHCITSLTHFFKCMLCLHNLQVGKGTGMWHEAFIFLTCALKHSYILSRFTDTTILQGNWG